MDQDIPFRSRIFHVERMSYTTSAGVQVSKDVIRHPGSVVILPVLEDGQIVFIRNRRISVDRRLIEVPAGTMEPPEPPDACARRELIEETGYRAGNIAPLSVFYPAPGLFDERMHLFVATQLTKDAPRREPGEEIENLILSLDQAMAMIRAGEILDAKTMLAVLLYTHPNVQATP